MRTAQFITFNGMGKSRLFLLTVFFLLTGTMSMHAADYYGFKICNVKVTSDNYKKINSSNFSGLSGTVSYDPDSETLTLNNATISAPSGKSAIRNESCMSLKIKCIGTNTISSTGASAIRHDYKGGMTLEVESGTTTINGGKEGIWIVNNKDGSDQYFFHIRGSGILNINASNNYPAISGDSDGSGLRFLGQIKANIYGKRSALYKLNVYFWPRPENEENGYEVTLKATGDSNYPVVRNCIMIDWHNDPQYWDSYTYPQDPAVLSPWGTQYDKSSKSFVNSSGTKIYDQNILVSNNYQALINERFFPDANFRSYIQSLYSKKYITASDVNTMTFMDCSGKNISSLTGIRYFTKLKTLNCSNNNLTSLKLKYNKALTTLNCSSNKITDLDLTLNTALTTLDISSNSFSDPELKYYNVAPSVQSLTCRNNTTLTEISWSSGKLTSLDVTGCTNLTSLFCSGNNLTILSVKNLPKLALLSCKNNTPMTSLDCSYNALTTLELFGCTNLATINAKGNKFTSFSINYFSNLDKLDISENTLMTSLNCYKNALTTLTLTNCPKLSELECQGNKLTSLSLSLPALTSLDCRSNQLASLDVNNCPNLSSLNCSSNKFTKLDVSSVGGLTTLDCSDNTLMTTLDCSLNNISKLNVSGCSKLATLFCGYNELTSLDLWLSSLTTLSCANNQLTSLDVSNCRNLAYLYCGSNKLTKLDVSGIGSTSNKLQKLDISYNTQLKTVYCQGNPYLQEVFADGCTALETLRCGSNNHNLTILNLNGCSALKELDCSSSNLPSLDVSEFSNLEKLNCSSAFDENTYNPIQNLSSCTNLKTLKCNWTKFDGNYFNNSISDLTKLEVLECSDQSNLGYLDLTNNAALKEVDCSFNWLSSLKLPSSVPNLEKLCCYRNRLDETAIDDVVSKLPDRGDKAESGFFCVYYSPKDGHYEHNVCTTQHVSDAWGKNWKTYQADNNQKFTLYEGATVPTAISTMEAGVDDDAPRYNMSGQRVGHNYKGIVIVNGRKMVK